MSDDDRNPSRLRQRLRQTEQERVGHLQRLLSERGPLIRGSFAEQPGRCGKPNCKCARGEYHSAAALYTRVDGRPTCTYVPVADRARVEALNRSDREFRKARAALAKLAKRTVELATALQDALTERYPSSTRAAEKKRLSKQRRRKAPPG